ncbi:MAG: RND family transporter [Saprospiraceae bacterium]|nr:RND family transporter [Saprospiraceae bacterium]
MNIFYRPKTIIAVLVTVTIFFAMGLSKLEVRNNFDGELPKDDPINQKYEMVKDHFDERAKILIGIETENIFNPATLQKIKDISQAMEEIPFVLPDEIKSLSTLKNVQERSWGLDINNFLDTIPTTDVALKRLQSDVLKNKIILGKFVSEDKKFTVITANLEDGFEGAEVLASVEEVKSQFESPEILHITGAPILVEDVQRGISGDSRRFIPAAILLVFLGFFFSFRRLRGTILPAIMVVMSIVWTMGFMGYTGLPITVVSNALPVIMVAVASSYGIHFMNSYYKYAETADDNQEAVMKTLINIGPPILITGITSALGSASLLIFKITSLKEFGIIGAAGFLFATIICLTLLPAVSFILPLQKSKLNSILNLQSIMDKITLNAIRNRYVVLSIYLLIIPVFAFWALKIQIGDDYTKFFPGSHQGRIAAEEFNDHLNGVRIMDVMIDVSKKGNIKDPNTFNTLSTFQNDILGIPYVGSAYSYIDVVKQMKENFNPTADSESEKPSMTAEEISQYLMLFEMSSEPGDLYTIMDESYERAKLQVFIKSSNPQDHRIVYDEINRKFNEHFSGYQISMALGGDVVNRIALSEYIVKGKVLNIILALLIVLMTCSLLFRSLKKGLFTIIPIVLSLVMIFGCMGMLGIRLGISTSLLTAMIVGIGIDFAVHYLVGFYNARKHHQVDNALSVTSTHIGKAIFFDAASNIAGFSVLSLSGFLPVQHFGWLLAFSMMLIFVNTIIVYPGLFSFKYRQRREVISTLATT